MRLLVTGGSGFIGTNICLEARLKGWEVIAMDSFIRPKSEENLKILKNVGVEILRGDVRFASDLQRSPIPDAIIHLAANPGIPWSIQWPAYDFEVNTKGTINVLEYSRIMSDQVGHKIPVIFASTNKVYSDMINDLPIEEKETRYEWAIEADREGIKENFPIDASSKYSHSPYGVSKLASDQYCQEYFHIYGVPVVVNRMSCIYGYYQKGVADQGWIDHFIREILFGNQELDIYGDGKQVRDMLFGTDVARLYLKEIEKIDKVQGQVFNIGGGKENTLSLIEAIKYIEELTGNKANINYHDWRHADQKIYVSDISKVITTLDWKPSISPQEGVQLMIEAYQKEGINI